MNTNPKGENAKNSNISPEEVAFKIIHASSYRGPVIIFDLRRRTLDEKGLPLTHEKAREVGALIADYVQHFEQMNSLILADDHRDCSFYATKEICEILQGKFSDMIWAGAFPHSKYIPCVSSEIQGKGHVHAWAHAEKGYSFGMLKLKSIPENYFQFNHIINGVENYLPEVVYWIMEALIDKELYYPALYNEKAEQHKLKLPAKIAKDPHMRIWHKTMKL